MLMRVVNTIVTAVAGVVLIFAAVVVLVATFGVDGEQVLPYGWFGAYLVVLNDVSGAQYALTISLSFLSIIVGLVLVAAQMPRPKRPRPLVVRADEAGTVTIEPNSVRVLAETVGAEVNGVREISCRVRERPGGLAIGCFPRVALGSNIPRLSTEMQVKIKESVESLVGLPVIEVSVVTKYETQRSRRLATE